jgi:hypothetical protein
MEQKTGKDLMPANVPPVTVLPVHSSGTSSISHLLQ